MNWKYQSLFLKSVCISELCPPRAWKQGQPPQMSRSGASISLSRNQDSLEKQLVLGPGLRCPGWGWDLFFCFVFKDFIYLTERDSERGNTSRGSERERSRLPAKQGAWCGARSQDPGVTTWAEGSRLTTEPPRRPRLGPLVSKSKGVLRLMGMCQWSQKLPCRVSPWPNLRYFDGPRERL